MKEKCADYIFPTASTLYVKYHQAQTSSAEQRTCSKR